MYSNKKVSISFIMIVYNTNEELLTKCIKSIVKYLDSDNELIIIDDGSTNHTEFVCGTFISPNIHYYYKTNGGAASARNFGLKVAKNDYIAFIDSDDYLIDNYQQIINTIDFNQDIIFLNYYTVSNWSSSLVKPKNLMNNDLNDRKLIIEALLGNNNIFGEYAIGAVWNKLFSRNFLIENNLFFDENVPKGQDVLFVIDCISKNTNIRYQDSEIYVYFVNNESICHKNNKNLLVYYDIYLKSLKNKIVDLVENNLINDKNAYDCYKLSIINCLYSTLKINALNKNIHYKYKERKAEALKIFNYFNQYMNFNELKIEKYNSIKEKIKINFIRRRRVFLLYVYEFFINKK